MIFGSICHYPKHRIANAEHIKKVLARRQCFSLTFSNAMSPNNGRLTPVPWR